MVMVYDTYLKERIASISFEEERYVSSASFTAFMFHCLSELVGGMWGEGVEVVPPPPPITTPTHHHPHPSPPPPHS